MQETYTVTTAYHFQPLSHLKEWRTLFLTECQSLGLIGTILIANEGVNLTVAGTLSAVNAFEAWLHQQKGFEYVIFKRSSALLKPFKRLFVKIKPEIITMNRPDFVPSESSAPAVNAKIFKEWLDAKKELTILDVRNDYETDTGHFKNAVCLPIENFREFPDAAQQLGSELKEKPLVMYCTGGVRCEKAAAVLLEMGFKEVYQLEGGILQYFIECGAAHYQGQCFVFDERGAIGAE